MNKNPTYIECQSCVQWYTQLSQDPHHSLCKRCNNTREVIDPKEILCNMCGECMCPLGTHNEQYPHGLHKASVMGGYDSYHLFDLTNYTFSFCEKCLRQLFNQCKIKPSLFVYNTSSDETWEKDQEAYEYMIWKDSGEFHQSYLNRKCNFIKNCPNDAVYTQLISNNFTEGCCCEEHKELHGYGNSTLTKFITHNLKVFL